MAIFCNSVDKTQHNQSWGLIPMCTSLLVCLSALQLFWFQI